MVSHVTKFTLAQGAWAKKQKTGGALRTAILPGGDEGSLMDMRNTVSRKAKAPNIVIVRSYLYDKRFLRS
jgi:hypothetical protein